MPSTTKKTEKEPKTKKADELPKLKGKYISAVGRRKTSVARVRLYKKGTGVIIVNDQKANEYFADNLLTIMSQPLKLTTHLKDLDFSVIVKGGGSKGQAEAIRHGITRSLVKMDEELKTNLKSKGFLSRDSRKKERKKPGLKKARRAAQWSKR